MLYPVSINGSHIPEINDATISVRGIIGQNQLSFYPMIRFQVYNDEGKPVKFPNQIKKISHLNYQIYIKKELL